MDEGENTGKQQKVPVIKLIGAFFVIYVVWGSSYLFVQFANETIPPFLMAAFCFLVAGSILFVYSMHKGVKDLRWLHVRSAFITGALLLLIGKGGVAWALQYLPSGLSAILVASQPFWVVLFGWLWFWKKKPSAKELFGVAAGLAGIVLLVAFGDSSSGEAGSFIGIAVIIVSAMSWAIGSLHITRAALAKPPVLAVSLQMLFGGILLFLTGTVLGELEEFDLEKISVLSWASLAYLTIFGSLLGFTAYNWLLGVVSPAFASTYAYVNPVVAVFLGWSLAGEVISLEMVLASTIIIGSVWFTSSKVIPATQVNEPVGAKGS